MSTDLMNEPLSGCGGVLMTDIDLARLDDVAIARIRDAFARHSVLLFRAQSLCPSSQIEFTRLFGSCEPHPLASHRGPPEHPELLVVEHRPGVRSRRNDVWHSDVSFSPQPPLVTVLHAIEVPAHRGDTLICNLVTACERLSPAFRHALEGLEAVHDAGPEVRQVHAQARGQEDLTAPEPTRHPVIWKLSDCEQETLYVNPYYVSHFVDMTAEESRPLLDTLFDIALRPEHIYRHRWQRGDVLLWDNRRTMHYAIRDYDDDTLRVMHRTTANP